MPKQDFDTLDYLGAVIVAVIFSIILFLISFCCINFFCITKYDEITKFEEYGAKRNLKLGSRPLKTVQKRLKEDSEWRRLR